MNIHRQLLNPAMKFTISVPNKLARDAPTKVNPIAPALFSSGRFSATRVITIGTTIENANPVGEYTISITLKFGAK